MRQSLTVFTSFFKYCLNRFVKSTLTYISQYLAHFKHRTSNVSICSCLLALKFGIVTAKQSLLVFAHFKQCWNTPHTRVYILHTKALLKLAVIAFPDIYINLSQVFGYFQALLKLSSKPTWVCSRFGHFKHRWNWLSSLYPQPFPWYCSHLFWCFVLFFVAHFKHCNCLLKAYMSLFTFYPL